VFLQEIAEKGIGSILSRCRMLGLRTKHGWQGVTGLIVLVAMEFFHGRRGNE
jgi:hypothetical protein